VLIEFVPPPGSSTEGNVSTLPRNKLRR